MFFSQYLNVRRKLKRGYIVEIFEYPELWMPEDQLTQLRVDLRQVARKSLDAQDLDYGVFSDDSGALKRSVIVLIKKESDNSPVAMSALPVLNIKTDTGKTRSVYHLGLVLVDPDERSKSLSQMLYGLSCSLLFLRGGLRPLTISSVTQVPAVFGMVSEVFSKVTPTPMKPQVADYETLQLARAIMAEHREAFGVGDEAEFDETRMVIQDAYKGGSDNLKKRYVDAPKHRDARYNDYCENALDYERGDDILQIGQIDGAALIQYIRKSLPKGSLRSFLAIGGFLTLQNFVLPIWYWFDTSHDYKTLSARHD